ncbi:MAG TPA: hypothetical protein VFH87_01705 [Candidatus Udaeobacter sp.]|nr:hypothetical protein [Candidatus Udaeobacter sp.]
MRLLACTLFLAPVVALGQVFHTDEEFYAYLEHKARMGAINEERARAAVASQEAERQSAREREHQAIIERLEDELYLNALRALE